MKKTQWYPAHVKPIRVGAYEVLVQVETDRFGTFEYEQGFAYFCDGLWGRIQSTPESAADHWVCGPGNQRKAWRGLAKEPQ